MPKTYTLTEVGETLEADPKTLRRWIEIEKWDLEKQTTPYDKRVKYLTEDQVKHLATVHFRQWPPKAKPVQEQAQAQGIPGKLAILEGRVKHLESAAADYATIDAVSELYQRFQKLEHDYSELLNKHTDLLLAVHELQSKKPGRKPKQGEVPAQGED